MALARCLNHKPKGRTASFIGYAKPKGYPDTALICGRPGCLKPAVICLNESEFHAYQQAVRIFEGPGNFAKMAADNTGLTMF